MTTTARGSSGELDPTPDVAKTQMALVSPLGRLARSLGTTTLVCALTLLILFLVVWYATPYYVCRFINAKGNTLPDYKLRAEWVQIHPLNCSMDLETVRLTKKSNEIPVPFFTCPRIHVGMQWEEIFHWTLRSRITLTRPVVNFVEGPTEATSQTALEPAWISTVKQLVPLRINRFTIVDGDIHYYDFHADPQINLEMDQLELSLDNLTNSNHSKELMPSTADLTGRPCKVGKLTAHVALNVDKKPPMFAEKVALENIPAPALNAFLAKYGKVYAKSGNLSFYTEMVSADGGFDGYAKPFFQNLEFEPVPKDRNGLAAIWASLVNGMKDLLQNDNKAVATKVPISGRYSDPNIGFWDAAFGLVKNAYLQALAHGFDQPEIAPDPEKEEISPTALHQAVERGAAPENPTPASPPSSPKLNVK